MERREFVRAMIAFGMAPQLAAQQTANPAPPPPAPVPWTLGLNAKTPQPHTAMAESVAVSDATFFSPEQMSALTHLSDVLMPPMGEKPGALMADTPAFLDFLVGKSSASRKGLYAGGLDWLNAEAKRKVWRAVCGDDGCASGCVDQAMVADVDDGSSAYGGACWVHQCGACGYTDGDDELEGVDCGSWAGGSGLGDEWAVLVSD